MTHTMLSLDDALEHVFALIKPLESQEIAINDAVGHVLAEPVMAQITQPPFDGSAMDGYAMASPDAQTGACLEMIGTSQAGARFVGTVKSGQCIRIFTGAPMPQGADTVIMQENASVDGEQITFTEGAPQGNNVRRAAQDFNAGDVLIAAGECLSSAHIALAAAANNETLQAARRPKIAILASGDELVPPGSALTKDHFISSNSIALKALLKPFAQSITDLGIAPDDETVLSQKLADALANDFDVIITSGGASVGDHDLIQPALKSLGVTIDFWKIAMRPGKPLMAGKKGKTLVFGLPGNPVSAMVTAQIIVVPALRKLVGDTQPLGPSMTLPLATPLPANGPRRHFIRAKIVDSPQGVAVMPTTETDSAHLSSLAASDVLIVHREKAPSLAKGTPVLCIPLL